MPIQDILMKRWAVVLAVAFFLSVARAAPLDHSENFLPEKSATQSHLEALVQKALNDNRPPRMEVHNECETPSLPSGRFHILIQAHKPKTCVTHWLYELGVTNAHVFVYRRFEAKTPLRTWHGPCGMLVQERLLTPNHNSSREAGVFLDYVLEHYQNPPLAVAVLHWAGPKDWHNDCAGTLGRLRYAYRGLAAPQRWPDAAEYASHMTTLTRALVDSDVLWMNMSLRFFKYPHEERIPSWIHRPAHDMRRHKACADVFTRYGIDVAAKTFYSCCATFVVPWQHILSLPSAFYSDLLETALNPEVEVTDPEFGYGCWEFAVWQWYKEPELTPRMENLYQQAQNVSLGLDLKRCLTPDREASLYVC
ncbi:hypothetical protein WJX73_005368 [Symbiochloris irregularis]|uniref:Uncharacterized protein n=1 Tax=Symbiochloris irregularis TaxID=706552 RepID=A0AAW1PVC0_9CHLO